jgi:hypothetical protein
LSKAFNQFISSASATVTLVANKLQDLSFTAIDPDLAFSSYANPEKLSFQKFLQIVLFYYPTLENNSFVSDPKIIVMFY